MFPLFSFTSVPDSIWPLCLVVSEVLQVTHTGVCLNVTCRSGTNRLSTVKVFCSLLLARVSLCLLVRKHSPSRCILLSDAMPAYHTAACFAYRCYGFCCLVAGNKRGRHIDFNSSLNGGRTPSKERLLDERQACHLLEKEASGLRTLQQPL